MIIVEYEQLDKLIELHKYHDFEDKTHTLTAYAIFDSTSQMFVIKVVEKDGFAGQVRTTQRVLCKQRESRRGRLMTLKSVVHNMRKIGFTKFTVLLEGDV